MNGTLSVIIFVYVVANAHNLEPMGPHQNGVVVVAVVEDQDHVAVEVPMLPLPAKGALVGAEERDLEVVLQLENPE